MIQTQLRNKEKYICYALFLIDPIVRWLHIPGHFAIVSLIFIGVGLLYFPSKSYRNILKSIPMILWLILTIYHFGNAMAKNVLEVNYIDLLHGLKIYFCIAIFVYWGQNNLLQMLKILYKTFFIYLIVVLAINSGSLGIGRLTGVVYATQVGQTAAITAFFGVSITFLKRRTNLTLFFYIFFPLIIAFLTQSRNAVMMIIIVLTGYFFAKAFRNGMNMVKIIRFLLIIFFCLGTLLIITLNSSLYQRSLTQVENHSMSYYKELNATGTIFDVIVGDRLVYYLEGWKFFKSNPITGIGMWGFQQKYGGPYPLHSEYMIHLCEGGIIAFVLWVAFIVCCVINIKKSKIESGFQIILFFGLFQFLFCGIYAREFYYEFFYPMIAMFLISNTTYNKNIMNKVRENDICYIQ